MTTKGLHQKFRRQLRLLPSISYFETAISKVILGRGTIKKEGAKGFLMSSHLNAV